LYQFNLSLFDLELEPYSEKNIRTGTVFKFSRSATLVAPWCKNKINTSRIEKQPEVVSYHIQTHKALVKIALFIFWQHIDTTHIV
jgi:hypothetical protein